MDTKKIVIGREEWVALPELRLPAIIARVDSGAKTSAIHAFNVRIIKDGKKQIVEFDIHPLPKNRSIVQHCSAEVIDYRIVQVANESKEKRFVIKTPVVLAGQTWEIEVTLTNRDSFGHRMLLGRKAMEGRVLVDPERTFSHGSMDHAKVFSLYSKCKTKKRSLKIALLASNPNLYSNKRIIEAAKARGHSITFVDIKTVYMSINPKSPGLYYSNGNIVERFDAVIPRLRPSMTFYGCALTRQFKLTGAFCLNDAYAIKRSRDKLLSLQTLAEKGIDMPLTGFANSPASTKGLIKEVKGAPLIIKLLEGTQGTGVVLAETNKAAESAINAFKSIKANILVQEFVKEARGTDIRCFVIDNKVVAAMQRKAEEGEFRSNLHRGGVATLITITPQERRMAVLAARIMELKVSGVDIIRSNTGPKILEINSSPGLEGIEKITGIDVANIMIESIEKHIFGLDK